VRSCANLVSVPQGTPSMVNGLRLISPSSKGNLPGLSEFNKSIDHFCRNFFRVLMMLGDR